MNSSEALAVNPVPACLLRRRSILSPKERVEARRYLRREYDAGATVRDLRDRTSRSYTLVYTLVKESGATMRSRGGGQRFS